MAASNVPASEIVLTIGCRNLLDKDVFSKSDPIVLVEISEDGSNWAEFSRTEHIKNNLNPDFATPIQINYRFEEVQRLRFKVYDVDNASSTLDDDDFLGVHECTLAQVVTAGVYDKPLTLGAKTKGKAGNILIRAEEVSTSKKVLSMTLNGIGLDKKDFLGKSDPYLEFAKENQDGSFTVLHRTKVIKNTLSPFWPEFKLKASLFGAESTRIKITCNDWDSDGSHDLIGICFTTLAELQSGQKLRWDLINEKKKKKKKSYKHSGVLECSVQVKEVHSFFDYMVGGCQLNFTIGVDFTGSNGDPKSPQSLHYMDLGSPTPTNQYTQALSAVGAVVQDYDSDKLFPAFGFGGKPPGQEVSHEFPLNANPQNPYCSGIQGVLDAYRYSLANVKLWGPTHAAPIINHVARFAQQADSNPEAQVYFVLLMLTDGALTDMSDTMSAIIQASHFPMSVIIVGIGDADFASMETLDSDDKLLTHHGQKAARDIVQFVPFRSFKHASKEALARAVLAEIPNQVVDYFEVKKIAPRLRPGH